MAYGAPDWWNVKASEFYRSYKTLTSAGAAYDDIDDDAVSSGDLLEVKVVSIENRNSNFTRIVVGISDGAVFHQYSEEDSPQANNIYTSNLEFVVPAGFFVRVRCTGCTANDVLHMYVQGKLISGD